MRVSLTACFRFTDLSLSLPNVSVRDASGSELSKR